MSLSEEEKLKLQQFRQLEALIKEGNKSKVLKHLEATHVTHESFVKLSSKTFSIPTYPVCAAAETGKLDILNLLISEGFCPMAKDVDECLNGCPIHYACIKGHVIVVRSLIKDHHVDVNCPDSSGETPIFWAVCSGNINIVREIVGSGGDVNAANPMALTTPLYNAVKENLLDICTYLISKGANVNSHNHQGHSPLYISVFKNNEAIAKVLLDNGADMNDNHNDQPFMVATGLENIPMMKLLYSRGADPEGRDREGNTPLHRSVSSNAYEVSRYLVVDLNVSLNIRNNHDLTSLTLAVQEGDREMANLIVKAGHKLWQEPWIRDRTHPLLKFANRKPELGPVFSDMMKAANRCLSLKEISCYKIRNAMGKRRNLTSDINSLDIRKCLQDFVNLKRISDKRLAPRQVDSGPTMINIGGFPFLHLQMH